jgi:hypothetical protein
MSLRRLVQERKADVNDALAASDRPEELILALRGFTGSSARPEVDVSRGKDRDKDGLRIAKRENKKPD